MVIGIVVSVFEDETRKAREQKGIKDVTNAVLLKKLDELSLQLKQQQTEIVSLRKNTIPKQVQSATSKLKAL